MIDVSIPVIICCLPPLQCQFQRVPLCSLGCHGTCYVVQASLKLAAIFLLFPRCKDYRNTSPHPSIAKIFVCLVHGCLAHAWIHVYVISGGSISRKGGYQRGRIRMTKWSPCWSTTALKLYKWIYSDQKICPTEPSLNFNFENLELRKQPPSHPHDDLVGSMALRHVLPPSLTAQFPP